MHRFGMNFVYTVYAMEQRIFNPSKQVSTDIVIRRLIPATFVFELLENLPEYAVSFACTRWDYTRVEFDLEDLEDGEKYTLDAEKAIIGFEKLVASIDAGELPGLTIGDGSWSDASNWDCFCVDALLQFAVLGEVIYG